MTFRWIQAWVLAAAIGAAMLGCDRQSAPPTLPATPSPQSLPVVQVNLAGRIFNLELANDERSRQMGLMYRDSMPGDHGMVFAFEDELPRGFWMKNTRIPLDIIYLDHAGTIVSIRSMRPYDVTEVPSGRPAKYAIELNQGVAAALGLNVGDRVELPAAVAAVPAR